MSDRARAHVDRFNAAVGSGDWESFVAGFTDGATMRFVGVPVPPAEGRAAILAQYEAQPPTDTMRVLDVDTTGALDTVRFAWTAGGTGTMRLAWEGDRVASLEVAFDGD